MTIKELKFIKELLIRVTPGDEQVQKALSFVNKDLAIYESRKGQLKEQYDYNNSPY